MVGEFFKNLPSGTVLYNSPYCGEENGDEVKYALEYCEENQLTSEDFAIKIVYEDEERTKKKSIMVVKK